MPQAADGKGLQRIASAPPKTEQSTAKGSNLNVRGNESAMQAQSGQR
jgi:hypothetical protein